MVSMIIDHHPHPSNQNLSAADKTAHAQPTLNPPLSPLFFQDLPFLAPSLRPLRHAAMGLKGKNAARQYFTETSMHDVMHVLQMQLDPHEPCIEVVCLVRQKCGRVLALSVCELWLDLGCEEDGIGWTRDHCASARSSDSLQHAG
jgi:hypothetical protein